MGQDNVIRLAFRSPHVDEDTMSFLACGYCANKTYKLIYDRADEFPVMQCAVCGQHIGRVGWAYDDDPAPGERNKG